ncbi:hypothetical protein EBU95_21030 [bacterium]|nr:hypothetical protein [bacterium]
MDEGKPKRKSSKPKKENVKPLASTPKDDPDYQYVQNLLSEILKEKLKQTDTRKVASLTTALINTMNEFLGSYIILGYSMDGHPVVISRSNNEMESDALTSLLMKYFTIVSNRLAKSINENPFE